MRRSRAATAESRDRVVTEAARLLRERGPDGVSVAEVMAAAGMTHGGFYTHFPTKDALLAAATERAFAEKLAALTGPAEAEERRAALLSYLDAYLSPAHVVALGSGCPIAGLASEAGRAAPALRDAMAAGVARTLDVVAGGLPTRSDARQEAIRILASAVGAVVLARALGSSDLAAEVIGAIRDGEALRPLIASAHPESAAG
jgi:TetR/AcrR family transcriptional repressor of nem operon